MKPTSYGPQSRNLRSGAAWFGTLVASLLLPGFVLGQGATDLAGTRPDLALLTKSGKLLTLQVNPKNLQIQIVGKKAAQIDLKPLQIQAQIIQPGGEENTLNLSRNANSFAPMNLPEFKRPAKLKVETRLKGKTEKFEFELKQEPLP